MTGQQGKTAGDWLTEGAAVVHSRFGTGTIVHVGDHKGRPALWVDFETGARRLLDVEYALPHRRPRSPRDATTPADPAEQCDYCGGRPVTVTVAGSDKVRHCCDTHRGDLAKDLVQVRSPFMTLIVPCTTLADQSFGSQYASADQQQSLNRIEVGQRVAIRIIAPARDTWQRGDDK